MSDNLTLFPAEAYVVEPFDEDEEWRDYWLRRWPCPACNAIPISEPGFEDDPYPTRADPCLGWLEGIQFACCGHGEQTRAYVLGPKGGPLYGPDALGYFRSRGVGPPLAEAA